MPQPFYSFIPAPRRFTYSCPDLFVSVREHIRALVNEMSEIHLKLYSKTCLKRPLKNNTKIGFQDRLSLNSGQKYCGMLEEEFPAILSTFIKLPFSIKAIVLSIFKWPLKTSFTVRIWASSQWKMITYDAGNFTITDHTMISDCEVSRMHDM